jgi:hypothetical protein
MELGIHNNNFIMKWMSVPSLENTCAKWKCPTASNFTKCVCVCVCFMRDLKLFFQNLEKKTWSFFFHGKSFEEIKIIFLKLKFDKSLPPPQLEKIKTFLSRFVILILGFKIPIKDSNFQLFFLCKFWWTHVYNLGMELCIFQKNWQWNVYINHLYI